uniref:Sodium/potassium-transporting ATPase subunit beta n=2 Tax=Strongyloides stercoralis TaxID=6248 RepID=A0A913I1V7_STRER
MGRLLGLFDFSNLPKDGTNMAKHNNPIEENNVLMANGVKSVERKGGFSSFLYNKHAGTFCGRTPKSWVQIIIFYVIFYTLLAAFWLACLKAFLNTLDPKVPRFYGKGTIIGNNPGVGYQPWIKEKADSTLVKFDSKNPDSYKQYIDVLDKYLGKYSNITGTRNCGPSDSNSQLIDADYNKGACRFDLSVFEKHGCSKENDYGFKEGKPCIILSLNRLIGWKPESYDDNEVPSEVQGRYKKGSIAFHCDGTSASDKENLGKVSYIPESGIDGKFYPYAFIDNYHQPIAMVKFENLPDNRLVMIECRAYAKNIEHDFETRLGLVHVELFKETDAAEAR